MQSGISDYLSDRTRHGSGFGLEIVKITKSIMVNKNLKLSAYYSRDHANGKIDGYKNEVIKYSSSLQCPIYILISHPSNSLIDNAKHPWWHGDRLSLNFYILVSVQESSNLETATASFCNKWLFSIDIMFSGARRE